MVLETVDDSLGWGEVAVADASNVIVKSLQGKESSGHHVAAVLSTRQLAPWKKKNSDLSTRI
jgi:hypothetical protein